MDFYEDSIQQAGRGPLFWMLIAMLITFLVTRVVTRRIRAGSRGLKNWNLGGVHVHHQVFGVLTILVAGCLEFAYQPPAPWSNVLGAFFGVGVSLTLDEFALWLHLDDVYWSPEGRKSIDAVFIAFLITGLLLVGITPFDLQSAPHELLATLAVSIVLNLTLTVITLLKAKPVLGTIGLLVPTVAAIGALRLAKPSSPWAAWRYPKGSAKRARAERRFGPGYQARWNRIRDLIGGAPDTAG